MTTKPKPYTTDSLIQMLQEQIQTNQKQSLIIDGLTQEIKLLREQIAYLTNKMYGRSKESLPEQVSGQLSLGLFEEPEIFEELETEETLTVRSHPRKKGTKANKIAHFPTKEVHHELSEEALDCEKCGSKMVDIGTKKVREEIQFHQARIDTLQHIQHSYCCKACEQKGESFFKKGPVPKPVIQNSLASPSLVAETIRLKFEQKVPAYRQEKYWQQLQLDISRDNIVNWHIRVSEDYLTPLIERLKQEFLHQDVGYADETPYRVLESEKATNYFWAFSNFEHSEKPFVIFHYAQTRSREIPRAFLADFKGYLHCDGYSSYDSLENILPVRCYAHVRRKFYEALPQTTACETIHPAEYVLNQLKKCFKLEQDWKPLSPKERLVQRKAELKPRMDALYRYVGEISAVPKSKLDKAIQYFMKYRKDLERVFEDGRLELTNNQSERLIKDLVMGRKNYLFSTSYAGAEALGNILSLLKTSELNGLNPSKYFTYLFEALPNLPVLTSKHVDDYLPWSPKVQEHCQA